MIRVCGCDLYLDEVQDRAAALYFVSDAHETHQHTRWDFDEKGREAG